MLIYSKGYGDSRAHRQNAIELFNISGGCKKSFVSNLDKLTTPLCEMAFQCVV